MKTVRVGSIKEFLNDDWKQPKQVRIVSPAVKLVTTLPLLATMTMNFVQKGFAESTKYVGTDVIEVGGDIGTRIGNAFTPIFDLISGISTPLCFITISLGMIYVMMGQKSKGLHLIKWASIGFVGLQFAPAIMLILQQVARAMSHT